MAEPSTVIYLAAPNYNEQESIFNTNLIDALEEIFSTKVLHPQIDGIDVLPSYTDFIKNELEAYKFANEKDKTNAIPRIVDIYNIGELLGRRSDICLACLDEHDEGIMIQQVLAKDFGKPVVSFRGDSRMRNPFPVPGDECGGANPYAVYISDKYFDFVKGCKPSEVARTIEPAIVELIRKYKGTKPVIPEHAKRILKVTRTLFDDVNVNNQRGLRELVKRYYNNLEAVKAAIAKTEKVF